MNVERPRAALAAADLHGDDGLARRERALAGGAKGLALANALEEHDDRLRLGVVDEEIHVVLDAAVDLVAG